jgi:hypothetical protein
VGIFDTAAQQAGLRASNFGGAFGGIQGLGQVSGFQNISAAEDRMRAHYQSNPYKAVKTFRDELQEETNEWLKDIKGE